MRRLAHLSPLKEKEVVLLADAFDDAAAWAIHDTLAVFRDALGVRSFNMGVLLAPMAGVTDRDFRLIIRREQCMIHFM